MGTHIRKQFSQEEVVSILKHYLSGELTSELAQEFLRIKRRQFFSLLKKYRDNPKAFSLEAPKRHIPHQLSKEVVKKIEKELEKEKSLIDDQHISVRRYNYSYVKTMLERKYVMLR